ncbi:MAG TPA: general secretion pathway protein GspJ, partial [Bradyrhizobium sp.]|nr:general secretion pathway protein GspJ [Bradyrhizobium sp.]
MIRAGTAQRTSERGFTLIEMIVALALMGLL